MDLDLSSIMSKLQDVLPFIDYAVDMMRRVLGVIAAFFGFDLEA